MPGGKSRGKRKTVGSGTWPRRYRTFTPVTIPRTVPRMSPGESCLQRLQRLQPPLLRVATVNVTYLAGVRLLGRERHAQSSLLWEALYWRIALPPSHTAQCRPACVKAWAESGGWGVLSRENTGIVEDNDKKPSVGCCSIQTSCCPKPRGQARQTRQSLDRELTGHWGTICLTSPKTLACHIMTNAQTKCCCS